MPSRAELVGNASVCQRSKYYLSQSANTLLKDFFDLTPPTVLDPSHTLTNFGAEQIVQFARAVGLEVTLASYGLPEDLLLRSSGGSGLAVRVPFGRSLFAGACDSTPGD